MVHHKWPDAATGVELIQMLRADLQHLGARDLHELLRCWELWHRTWVGEAHMRHLLYRRETRWPEYYYRAHYPNLPTAKVTPRLPSGYGAF